VQAARIAATHATAALDKAARETWRRNLNNEPRPTLDFALETSPKMSV
jgi:hypothetical protein